MKPREKGKRAGRAAPKPVAASKKGWLLAAVVLAAVALGFAWHYREKILWDFRLTYCAAWMYRHGQNPFDNQKFFTVSGEYGFPFAYPLASTLIFMPLTWLDWPVAASVWLGGTSVLLGLLVVFWWRQFSGDRRHPWFPLLALLVFNLAIPKTLLTGNAVILETLLLWVAFLFLARGNLPGFVAFLLPAASFKMSPMIFLALPLIHPQLRRWKVLILAGALFAGYLAGSYALAPGWFKDYQANVSFNVKEWSQVDVFNPSTYALSRRLITTFLASLSVRSSLLCSVALDIVLIAPILVISAKGAQALTGRTWNEAGRPAILYATLVYALITPRFSDYSFILVIPAALYVAGTVLPKSQYWYLLAALLAPVPFISFREPGSGVMLEGDFFFGAWGYWSLLMVFVCWALFSRHLLRQVLRPTGSKFSLAKASF